MSQGERPCDTQLVHSLAAIVLAAALAAQAIDVRCGGAIPERVSALFSEFGVVLLSKDGIDVLDPRSGESKWHQSLSSDSRIERPAVVVGEAVILSNADALEAYSIEDGHLLWRQKRGRVRILSATPHLVARVVVGHRSKVLRVDPASGNVLAERIARESESMVEMSGVILDVQFPNESDGVGYVVVAYNPDDLRELWRFRQAGAASFVAYEGVPYFETLSALFPIDLATGARGPRLPPTGPVDSIWGGSTRELDITDDLDAHSRLRRNDVESGKALWVTDVPFDVFNTLRDGDTLYVTGGTGQENDPHSLAAIDWRAGTLKKVAGPIPLIYQWGKVRDSIVATTWDNRLICLTP